MEIMVSVLTTAYNHEPYIRDALESFVVQKTSFPFEVIVHDDASTDGTAAIIREYAQKYPEIIRPILQTENQFSQGISPYEHIMAQARGKYVALCEGDDFWCDEYKLQKQIDYMEAHPECSLCFSNSHVVDVNGNIIAEKTPVKESRVLSSRELIAANHMFYSTATTVMKKQDYLDFPKEMAEGPAGDIMVRNFMMTRGCAYGFKEPMACYRNMTPGSYSDNYHKNMRKHRDKFIRDIEAYLRNYERFDAYTKGAYRQEIAENVNRLRYSVYLAKSDWKALHQEPYRAWFATKSFKVKGIVWLKYFCPWLVKLIRFLRYGKAGLDIKY